MARHFRYYDSAWQRDAFTCPNCSWQGTSKAMAKDHFNELMDLSCPSCGKMILIVSYPTMEDIEQAAREGNAEAQRELALILQSREKNS